jgi:protein-S-isoprenylcysteine O-methyltransferase Ste14
MKSDIGKWVFSLTALAFIFLFISIEGKLRKGKEAIDMVPTKEDNSSTRFVGLNFGISMIAITLSIVLNIFSIGYYDAIWTSFVGISGIAIGIFIRISAAKTLGRFYTRILKITDNHQLVEEGLYKFIRHPGYLGVIILFISAGITSRNLLCLLIIVITILPAYLYRISVEEKMLAEQFGDVYRSYQKRSARLIPWIY